MTMAYYTIAINFWLTTCKAVSNRKDTYHMCNILLFTEIIYIPMYYSFKLKYFQQNVMVVVLSILARFHQKDAHLCTRARAERTWQKDRKDWQAHGEKEMLNRIYMGSTDGSADPTSPLYGSGFYSRPIGHRVPEILPAQTRQTS